MLEELRITSLGVIEDAVLPLAPGLTVVTGETGAGKTMVVTGLSLLFGGRADAGRVRTGAAQASVDGQLSLDLAEPALAQLHQRVTDAGGDLDVDAHSANAALTLRRVVASTGRSRAYVGGAPAPASLLVDLGETLLAMHGQSDQLRLTRPAEQRSLLDRYAGVELAEFAEAFAAWRDAAQALADRTAGAREMRLESELLSAGVAEIDAAELQVGEDADLNAQANRLGHADSLRIAGQSAYEALRGDGSDGFGAPSDASALIDVAVRQLTAVAGADPALDEIASRARDLSALADDLAADLAHYVDGVDADPEKLAQIESRRALIAALVRRYGDDLASVLAWAERARAKLDDLDVSDDALLALAARRDEWAKRVAVQAETLRQSRLAAAHRLAKEVQGELAGLAMPSAQLEIHVRPRPVTAGVSELSVDGVASGVTADGADEVEMLLRPHPSSPAVALQKGASGGELSRVMLALEVCLAGSERGTTMVFDEVDSGVGGRAAVEVGRRLARLARNHQVVVVTHLPQVAAFGERHVVVDKTADDVVSSSDLRVVEGEDRVAELARMLGGRDTSAARQHATEMLTEAAQEFGGKGSDDAPTASANAKRGRRSPAQRVHTQG